MNSSLFGSREYCNQPYPYGYAGIYSGGSQYSYSQYLAPPPSPTYQQHNYLPPTYQQPPTRPSYRYPTYHNPYLQAYPYGNSHLSYGLYELPYPYYNHFNYSWRDPKVIIPAKGLETILIAILILVALDILFVRSRH